MSCGSPSHRQDTHELWFSSLLPTDNTHELWFSSLLPTDRTHMSCGSPPSSPQTGQTWVVVLLPPPHRQDTHELWFSSLLPTDRTHELWFSFPQTGHTWVVVLLPPSYRQDTHELWFSLLPTDRTHMSCGSPPSFLQTGHTWVVVLLPIFPQCSLDSSTVSYCFSLQTEHLRRNALLVEELEIKHLWSWLDYILWYWITWVHVCHLYMYSSFT